MDKELKKELRKLLTGRTIRNEDGWLIAIPDGSRFIYHGASDNMGRKILRRSASLPVAEDPEKAFHQVLEALQQIGILVDMQTQPNALCALKRFYLTKAVLICVTPERNGSVLAQAYTGRSLLSSFYCRRILLQLKQLLQNS